MRSRSYESKVKLYYQKLMDIYKTRGILSVVDVAEVANVPQKKVKRFVGSLQSFGLELPTVYKEIEARTRVQYKTLWEHYENKGRLTTNDVCRLIDIPSNQIFRLKSAGKRYDLEMPPLWNSYYEKAKDRHSSLWDAYNAKNAPLSIDDCKSILGEKSYNYILHSIEKHGFELPPIDRPKRRTAPPKQAPSPPLPPPEGNSIREENLYSEGLSVLRVRKGENGSLIYMLR